VQRDSLVTQNYAQAFLNVLKKSGRGLGEALEETRGLAQLLVDYPKLRVFLEGPQFRTEDKIRVATDAFKENCADSFLSLIKLLINNDRIEYLHDVLDKVEQLILKEQGITPGLVTTAIPLTEEEKDKVRSQLENYASKHFKTGENQDVRRQFELNYKVDKRLIAGVKVKFEDVLIDTTIDTYLGELRAKLKQARLAS